MPDYSHMDNLNQQDATFSKLYLQALERARKVFLDRQAEGRNTFLPPVAFFPFAEKSHATLIWMKCCRLIGDIQSGNRGKALEEAEDLINYSAFLWAELMMQRDRNIRLIPNAIGAQDVMAHFVKHAFSAEDQLIDHWHSIAEMYDAYSAFSWHLWSANEPVALETIDFSRFQDYIMSRFKCMSRKLKQGGTVTEARCKFASDPLFAPSPLTGIAVPAFFTEEELSVGIGRRP